jgi:hypothetical protein
VREILIVDDGSDERTRQSQRALAREAPNVRLLQRTGAPGRSRARNEGLAHATGDLVLFLDDDDLLDRRMIESAIACFTAAPEADVVTCRGEFWYVDAGLEHNPGISPFLADAGRTIPGWVRLLLGTSTRHVRDIERRPVRTLLTFGWPINSCVVRRDAIGATRFDEQFDCGEDTLFWMTLARKGVRFRFSAGGRCYVRRHHGNYSAQLRRPCSLAMAQRLVAGTAGLGREERFLAAAHLFRVVRRHSGKGGLRLLRSFVQWPDMVVKYGWRLCTRSIYRRLRRSAATSVVSADAAGTDSCCTSRRVRSSRPDEIPHAAGSRR